MWELFYSDGGHGGPYHTHGTAIEAARRYIGGFRFRRVEVEVRERGTGRGGFKAGNPRSLYITEPFTAEELAILGLICPKTFQRTGYEFSPQWSCSHERGMRACVQRVTGAPR